MGGDCRICLAGYWVLMRFVPVPGFGIPTHDIPFLDRDRNLAAWIDRHVFPGHLYEGTRDPEGLLSTIPAIATCAVWGPHRGLASLRRESQAEDGYGCWRWESRGSW